MDPKDLLWFARVVAEGSFSRAAQRLGVPKSTLSRRISALEAQMGERLLLRTTRKLALTDLGQAVLHHAQQVGAELDAAYALTQQRQQQPSGRLRISMPADLANDTMSAFLARFLRDYPAISVEMDLSPRRVDVIGEAYDVAIRMGSLADDASLAARRLARYAMALYASPAYLKTHGTPHEPEALMEHSTLGLLGRSGEPASWRLLRASQPESSWEGIPSSLVTANSPELLRRLAMEGVGIALIATPFSQCYVREGSLIRVLPEWRSPEIEAWAVFPGRRLMPSRTRVFIDAMVQEFNQLFRLDVD